MSLAAATIMACSGGCSTYWRSTNVSTLRHASHQADLLGPGGAAGKVSAIQQGQATPGSSRYEGGRPGRLVVCYAPDTPWEKMNEHAKRRVPWADPLLDAFEFADNDRWASTAMSGSNLSQGQPTVLTWSIVPDGTPVDGFADEPDSPSDLIAFLDNIYGGAAEPNLVEKPWFPLVEQVFARWGELTGNTYVYEPNDDGSSWRALGPFNVDIDDGEVGVRGDVRIAGHTIDGDYGVLAYNFYPDLGDMVMDTSDAFFSSTGSNSRRLRNVMMHEHGHGLGIAHVCPVDQTKLMEPFATTVFDGPQHDDVQAGQRGYGDHHEDNDDITGATDLGGPPLGLTLTEGDVSIDDFSDDDYYSVSVADGSRISVTVTPVGSTYLSGPQNSDGSCSSGTSFNSLIQSDLGQELIGPDQSTVLASAAGNPAGVAESIFNLNLTAGAGQYYVRVFGNVNTVQLYELSVTVDIACDTLQITQQPASQAVCQGDPATFSVTATGTTPLDYQWRKNGLDISGATSDSLTIDPAGPADSADYDIVITDDCDQTVTSDIATLTVQQIDADLDSDCDVDIADLAAMASVWLVDCTQIDCGGADLYANAFIDLADYALFVRDWMTSP